MGGEPLLDPGMLEHAEAPPLLHPLQLLEDADVEVEVDADADAGAEPPGRCGNDGQLVVR